MCSRQATKEGKTCAAENVFCGDIGDTKMIDLGLFYIAASVTFALIRAIYVWSWHGSGSGYGIPQMKNPPPMPRPPRLYATPTCVPPMPCWRGPSPTQITPIPHQPQRTKCQFCDALADYQLFYDMVYKVDEDGTLHNEMTVVTVDIIGTVVGGTYITFKHCPICGRRQE